jgi:hypothetical protein
MNQNEHRRPSITRKIMSSAYAIPRLNGRITEVLRLPNLTQAQTAELKSIPKRIGVLIESIQEALGADDGYSRLIENMDRLRREIAEADASVHRLLKRIA